VRAVTESAVGGEIDDVGEGPVDALRGVPDPDGTQAGRVHEHPAAGQRQELAVDGGVATLAVARADVADGQGVLAEQGVRQGRLAGARGADEHRGAPHDGGHLVQAVARHGADGHDLDTGRREGQLLEGGDERRAVLVLVDLGQDGRGRRAALPGQGDEPLHAAGPPPGAEGDRDEHGVDVGGQDLALGAPRDGRARERGAPG
jgi:hypothetical protein